LRTLTCQFVLLLYAWAASGLPAVIHLAQVEPDRPGDACCAHALEAGGHAEGPRPDETPPESDHDADQCPTCQAIALLKQSVVADSGGAMLPAQDVCEIVPVVGESPRQTAPASPAVPRGPPALR
jgi:hypothetical protein